MNEFLLSSPHEAENCAYALKFCSEFFSNNSRPHYLFGRNIYGKSIIEQASIDAFIDDFTDDKLFLDKPIIKSSEIPQEALVIITSGGRPLTVKKHLEKMGIMFIDYFAFRKYSDLKLTPLVFNEDAETDYAIHKAEYLRIFNLLEDAESKYVFQKLVSFRVKQDLNFLKGFRQREHEQYFENFLRLKKNNETFIDVGGFDGFTSKEFIKRCPNYKAIHIFEPELSNYKKCTLELETYPKITIHKIGLSNKKSILKFSSQGSGSCFSNNGQSSINVEKLDSFSIDNPTFIKMDIEGAEKNALKGCENTIKKGHPKLAIAVYHNPSDFHEIPNIILSIRNDYRVYLRHYTESIYETIMFFVPK